MKLFSKFALLGALAMFAFACEKGAEAPKSIFTFESDDLTVTFTNASTNANAYAWNFGDGNTSVEASPVHTYEAEGTYTVTLTVEGEGGAHTSTAEVMVFKPLIKLDGNFADWSEVSAEKLVSATLNETAAYTALKNLKVCADAQFIYFYVEYDSEQVAPLDIFINSDNSALTGGSSWLWSDCGADYLIEGFVTDGKAMSDAIIFNWPADAPTEGWEWVEVVPAGSGVVTMSDIKTVSGNINAFEARITRELIPGTLSDEIGFGLFSSNADWAETGALPSSASDAEVKSPLLTVKLK